MAAKGGVKYKSTRGLQSGRTFEQVVLAGLADDKGLFVPESIPQFSLEKIESMRGLSYSELACEVISAFVSSMRRQSCHRERDRC